MSHLNILCTVHLVIYQLTDIFCEGYRSNHFIVGLTNVSPTVTAPTLWNYTVCGQYPTPVADGATVTMRCTSKHLYYQPHLCRVYSPCGVPQNTCITNHTCVASTHHAVYLKTPVLSTTPVSRLLTCGVPPPCRRTDTSSCSFRRRISQISVKWKSMFAVSWERRFDVEIWEPI